MILRVISLRVGPLRAVEVSDTFFNSDRSEVLDPVPEIDVAPSGVSTGSGHFQIQREMPMAKDEAVNRFVGQLLFAKLPNPFVFRPSDLRIQMTFSCPAVA